MPEAITDYAKCDSVYVRAFAAGLKRIV